MLQALVETGILGFMLLMIPLLWVLKRFFGRQYRQFRDPWTIQARLTLAGCLASMALLITSVFFYNVPWLMFIWSLFAITAAETVVENRWFAETDLAYADSDSLS